MAGSGGGRPPRSPILLIAVLFGAAVLGIGLLTAGIFGVARAMANRSAATATATFVVLPTQVVLIPTTTPLPPATDTPTSIATRTAAPPTRTPAATTTDVISGTASVTSTASAEFMLTVIAGANVRAGPGTNYESIIGIPAGEVVPAIGRNEAGDWFAINYSGAPNGRGWLADVVVSYTGDPSSLPVLAAPPPPAFTATPRPGNNGNPASTIVTGAHGISGQLTLCTAKFVYAVGESICYVQWIKNTTDHVVGYGILGVLPVGLGNTSAPFHTNWDGAGIADGLLKIDAGCPGPRENCLGEFKDVGLRISTPGSYRLLQSMCFAEFKVCQTGGGVWETISGGLDITVR
jgi:hypothetical protein